MIFLLLAVAFSLFVSVVSLVHSIVTGKRPRKVRRLRPINLDKLGRNGGK